MLSGPQIISAELRSSKHWELTEEGKEIAEQGSQEARVFNAVPLEGLTQSDLMVRLTESYVIAYLSSQRGTQGEKKPFQYYILCAPTNLNCVY